MYLIMIIIMTMTMTITILYYIWHVFDYDTRNSSIEKYRLIHTYQVKK